MKALNRVLFHLHGVLFGKPSRCPYCKSTDIQTARGHWECRDCGQEGSY